MITKNVYISNKYNYMHYFWNSAHIIINNPCMVCPFFGYIAGFIHFSSTTEHPCTKGSLQMSTSPEENARKAEVLISNTAKSCHSSLLADYFIPKQFYYNRDVNIIRKSPTGVWIAMTKTASLNVAFL